MSQLIADSCRQRSGEATVIATLPPPMTGMTTVTQRVVSKLSARGGVHMVNLSRGGAAHRRGWKLIRSFRQVWAAIKVFAGRAGKGNLYIALNSGAAVGLDLLLVAAARLRRRRVYAHHHSFRFLNATSPLLKMVYRVGGDSIVDVVLCDRMADILRSSYGRSDIRVVPNLVDVSEHGARTMEPRSGPFMLGHLANLTVEKGVERVIVAFEYVRNQGLDVELHLAGPFGDDQAKDIIERAVAEWPEAIIYHGGLYGKDKQAFYTSLDLFAYPTSYSVEAQPLVLLEALGAGVPVVSVDRGCIGSLAAAAFGDSVQMAGLDDFAEVVAGVALRIKTGGPAERLRYRDEACATAVTFAAKATESLDQLVDEILRVKQNDPIKAEK